MLSIEGMEADMSLDENTAQRLRQDLLEAMTSGFGGPACAPMPGIMLEMLEIAAMERREANGLTAAQQDMAPAPLTSAQNGSGMTAWLPGARKAVADATNAFRTLLGARRVPV